MSWNDMLNDFSNILDRNDADPDLLQTFLTQGIQRVQRVCRLPSMERAMLITPVTTPMVQFPVPKDLIQVIDLMVPMIGSTTGQMKPLLKWAYRRVMQLDNTDIPRAFGRFQSQIYIGGAVPIGVQAQFLYYGNFSPFQTPDSENELSASTPDLGVYAALGYAGDHFEHPLTQSWKQTFLDIKGEVIQMAFDLENEGGVNEIEPLYHSNDGWDSY